MSARSGLTGKKKLPAPFGPLWAHFLRGPENRKNDQILPVFLGGPMGPIHPVWGHLVIFGRAGKTLAPLK